MFALTIYALVGDDMRLLFAHQSNDVTFSNITIVVMALFTVELGLSSFAHEEYFGSFFFWLDLISTVSLLTDIEQFMDMFQGKSEVQNSGTNIS